MMDYLKQQLEAGRNTVTIMSVAGNTQIALKIKVVSADTIGVVARVKGMMGGFSEPRLLPWSCISMMNWD